MKKHYITCQCYLFSRASDQAKCFSLVILMKIYIYIFFNLKHFNACYRNAPLLYMVFILDCSEGILRRNVCLTSYTFCIVNKME